MTAVPTYRLTVSREPLVGFEPTTARLRIESSTPELQWLASNEGARVRRAPDSRCPGADSNRDAFRHYPLKIACLPVSPPGRAASKIAAGKGGSNPRGAPASGCQVTTNVTHGGTGCPGLALRSR